MSLPFPVAGTPARTYRLELQALAADRLAERTETEWRRTPLGDLRIDKDPGESGMRPAVREPTTILQTRVAVPVVDAIDKLAEAAGKSRAEYLRDYVTELARLGRRTG